MFFYFDSYGRFKIISDSRRNDMNEIIKVYQFASEIEKLKTIQRKSDTLDGRYEYYFLFFR